MRFVSERRMKNVMCAVRFGSKHFRPIGCGITAKSTIVVMSMHTAKVVSSITKKVSVFVAVVHYFSFSSRCV